MSGEQELPKVGEWWWYGFASHGFMKMCRIVAVNGRQIGIIESNGFTSCIPQGWLLGKVDEHDIPAKPDSVQNPWWRFWK